MNEEAQDKLVIEDSLEPLVKLEKEVPQVAQVLLGHQDLQDQMDNLDQQEQGENVVDLEQQDLKDKEVNEDH